MTQEVIHDYVYDNLNPIELNVGDPVKLGETTDPNGPYPHWIFCTSDRTGQTGWVAMHILSITGDTGVSTQNYSAKEMTVSAGDVVDTVYELNGWYWCVRRKDSEEGWIAKNNLHLMR